MKFISCSPNESLVIICTKIVVEMNSKNICHDYAYLSILHSLKDTQWTKSSSHWCSQGCTGGGQAGGKGLNREGKQICKALRADVTLAGGIPAKMWANTILTVDSPECLTVSLTVRSQWAHCYHCMVSSSVDLTNRSQQAHGVRCKLMEDSQQGHSVRLSCELAVW